MEATKLGQMKTSITPVATKNEETSLAKMEFNEISYKVGGELVTLNKQSMLTLSRGNTFITPTEMTLFAELCKYQKLNPFLNEAYIVKYDATKPASFVIGYETFRKRADASPQFEGLDEGIVVLTQDNTLVYRQGSIVIPSENLIGGYAQCTRNDRKIPIRAEVGLKEYHKNQSTWNTMPATMIKKVAVAQCLRAAFPDRMSGLYIIEEFADKIETINGNITNEIQAESQDIDTSKYDILQENIHDAEADVVDVVQETAFEYNEPQITTGEVIIVDWDTYSKNKDLYERVNQEDIQNGFNHNGYNATTKKLFVMLKNA